MRKRSLSLVRLPWDKHLDGYGLSVQNIVKIGLAHLEGSLPGYIGWRGSATIPFGDIFGRNANWQPRARERLALLPGGSATQALKYGSSVQITDTFGLAVGCDTRRAKASCGEGEGAHCAGTPPAETRQGRRERGQPPTDAEAERQARGH